MRAKWEKVDGDMTKRLAVYGGWLVVVGDRRPVFVVDDRHRWDLEDPYTL